MLLHRFAVRQFSLNSLWIDSRLPYVRVSRRMKDGDDEDFLWGILIKNRVREPFNHCLPILFMHCGEESWVAGNSLHNFSYLSDEIFSESLPPCLIPVRRFIELGLGLRKKSNSFLHCPSLANASDSTSSQSIAASGLAR